MKNTLSTDLQPLAVAYLRVSTNDQDYQSQLETIQTYCETNNFNLVKTFEEKISGANRKRPEFSKLEKYLYDKTNKIDYCICSDLSRLGRNADVHTFAHKLIDNKICLISIHGNIRTLDENKNKIPAQLLLLETISSINSFFLDTIKHHIKRGLNHAVSIGHSLGGYTLAFGYYINKQVLTINETEAETVKLIFNLSLEMGCRNISKYLNQREIPSQKNGKWNDASINRMLKNPLYMGQRRYKNTLVDAPQLRIVSDEIFNQVQKRLKEKDNKQGINRRYEYLLDKKKIQCGCCGKHYYAKRVRNNPIYQCISYRTPETKCGNRSINCNKLETNITNYLLSNFSNHILNQIDTQNFDISIANLNESLNDYTILLKKETKKESDLIPMLLNDKISEEEFDTNRNICKKEKNVLQQKINELTIEIERLQVLKRNKTDLQKIAENIKINGIDRTMIRNIVNKITIYPEHEIKLCSFKGDLVYRVVLNINNIDFTLYMSQRSKEVQTSEYLNIDLMELSLRDAMKRNNVIPSNKV